MNWTNSANYPSLSDYEYTLDSGASVFPVTAKPQSVGNVSKSAGQVGVRVKATANNYASGWLFNSVPFTVSTTTTPTPTPTPPPTTGSFTNVRAAIDVGSAVNNGEWVADTNYRTGGTEVTQQADYSGVADAPPQLITNTVVYHYGSGSQSYLLTGFAAAEELKIEVFLQSPTTGTFWTTGISLNGVAQPIIDSAAETASTPIKGFKKTYFIPASSTGELTILFSGGTEYPTVSAIRVLSR